MGILPSAQKQAGDEKTREHKKEINAEPAQIRHSCKDARQTTASQSQDSAMGRETYIVRHSNSVAFFGDGKATNRARVTLNL